VDIPALVYEARPVSVSHSSASSAHIAQAACLLGPQQLEAEGSVMQVRRNSSEHLHEVASDSAWAHAMRPRRMHDVTTGGLGTRRAGAHGA
jgi:hypothetical protein